MTVTEPAPTPRPRKPTDRFPVPAPRAARLRELQRAAAVGGVKAAHALNLECATLKKQGYTLQAIADVLGLTRQGVNLRCEKVPAAELAHVELIIDRRLPVEPKPVKPRLTELEVAELKRLHPLARRRNRVLRFDPVVTAAAAEFDAIVLAAHRRGVSGYSISQELGLTPHAILWRLNRLLGKPLPASMQPKEPVDPLAGHEEVLERIRALLPLARTARGYADTPAGRASRELDELLVFLVDGHQVPVNRLAAAIGRANNAVGMRLAKARAAGVGPGTDDGDPVADPAADGAPQASGPGTQAPDQAPGRGPRGALYAFTAEATESAPARPGSVFTVDPALRAERTGAHHDLVRRIRAAAQARGFDVRVWNVGQDAAFLLGGFVVNIEVKTLPEQDSADDQLRLGCGQLHQQVEQHLANAATLPWYAQAGVVGVCPVLAVSDPARVDPVWWRMAARLGHLLIAADELARHIATPGLGWLPQPVPTQG